MFQESVREINDQLIPETHKAWINHGRDPNPYFTLIPLKNGSWQDQGAGLNAAFAADALLSSCKYIGKSSRG